MAKNQTKPNHANMLLGPLPNLWTKSGFGLAKI